MSERVTEEYIVRHNIKRLRRFSLTLTANAEAADAAVCAAIQSNRHSLTSSEDFGRIFHALLREVYRNLYAQSDRRRKLSIMKPDLSKDVALSVKLQSLDIDKRAAISLHLIEDLSMSEIASILDIPGDQVESLIDQSIASLASCEAETNRSEQNVRAVLN